VVTKFLTIVADHDTGNVVWVGKQRSKTAFEEFFTALGPQRAAAIEAISLDGSSVYLPVTREQIPQARICLDPFHVIKWTNESSNPSTGRSTTVPSRTGTTLRPRVATHRLRDPGRPGTPRRPTPDLQPPDPARRLALVDPSTVGSSVDGSTSRAG
jgi:transposase